jgi:Fe-S-cluster containining protein
MRARGEVLRFACTLCGKCCNRAPEVELSEAAALLDVFVFRLMFRLYWLPSQAKDYLEWGNRKQRSSSVFFEKKRLLNAFSARRYQAKGLRDGKRVAFTKYLVISALALDTVDGECGALGGNKCSIHERRPLSCRSVPLHYSRAEANAAADLEAFVGTKGYRCDTSDAAPVILEDGRIVDPMIVAARSRAIEVAGRDRPWSEAIARRMGGPVSPALSLPSLEEIEANAGLGALTVSMRAAWMIAADAGLITAGECDRRIGLQLQTIRSELASGRCSTDAIETLREMEKEYAGHRGGSPAIMMESPHF